MSPRMRVGLVSGVVPHLATRVAPLVSAAPRPVTTWRHLGMPPTGLVAGEMPRKRTATPREYDLLDLVAGIVAAPVVLPALMLRSIAEGVREQARYEEDIESGLRAELLRLHMRYESGEISEAEYREREAKLRRRLEGIGG